VTQLFPTRSAEMQKQVKRIDKTNIIDSAGLEKVSIGGSNLL